MSTVNRPNPYKPNLSKYPLLAYENVRQLMINERKERGWGNRLTRHNKYNYVPSKRNNKSNKNNKNNKHTCNAMMNKTLKYKNGHGRNREITIRKALKGCLDPECGFKHKDQTKPTRKKGQCRFNRLEQIAKKELEKVCPRCKVGGRQYVTLQESILNNSSIIQSINVIINTINDINDNSFQETLYQLLINSINSPDIPLRFNNPNMPDLYISTMKDLNLQLRNNSDEHYRNNLIRDLHRINP